MINQKTFNIFFSFLFIFFMFMLFKEEKNVPLNYKENMQKSLLITQDTIVPSLESVLGDVVTEYGTKGTRNNLKYAMRYVLIFSIPSDFKSKKELIKNQGWTEYTKEYQEEKVSTFCRDKFQLILTLEVDSLSVEVIYDRLSPCWKLEEKLKSDTFSLVQ